VNLPSKGREDVKVIKSVASFGAFWEKYQPVIYLGIDSFEKKDILDSQAGDAYRLVFGARADDDQIVEVVARSQNGKEFSIGKFEIKKESDGGTFEKIFVADGKYQDLIFKRNGKEVLPESRIYIYNVRLTRLERVSNLDKTIFGKTDILNVGSFDGDAYDAEVLSRKGKTVSQFVEIEKGGILFVDMKIEKVGNGGGGKYRISIKDPSKEKGKKKYLKSLNFDSKSLGKYAKDEGLYRFELPVYSKNGGKYELEISNSEVEVDSGNYLKLGGFGDGQESFFNVIATKYYEDSNGERILTNAVFEDLGSEYLYCYENNGYVTDLLDVFESNESLQYDWFRNSLRNTGKKGSFYTYKIDTVKPFKSFRIEAKQLEIEKDQIKIEYSFDNENWKNLTYVQEKNGPQIFDHSFSNEGNHDAVFIRVGYGDDGSSAFGLEKFKVTAYISK